MNFIQLRFVIFTVLFGSYSAIGLTDSFQNALVKAAIERTEHQVEYNGAYYSIKYPGGDVPAEFGVCTDVVIRSYRQLGLDLQKELHEDISASFAAYPSKRLWGLSKPDSNIDHRRVPNLRVFFERQGESLPISIDAKDYQAGDLVTWMLPGNLPHIGIVTDRMSGDQQRPLIIHNIGQGPQLEDMIFRFKITGHYRYFPKDKMIAVK